MLMRRTSIMLWEMAGFFLGESSEIDWGLFKNHIQEACWAIPQEVNNRLVLSMPRGLQAVRRARRLVYKSIDMKIL